MSETTFVPDGEWLIPQPRAAGPWFAGVQHGGAITGLIARAIEALPSAEPMFVTRMSFDMSRKVPMGRTRVEAEPVRDGRRVQSIECRYIVEDEIVARATATRIRIDKTVMADGDAVLEGTTDVPPATPDEVPEMQYTND
ncbi:MAG: thioesterase family protein, partial [Acidobacteria bacterium]|nr:thioesterase family protein [Acidobacteriota bacterium]